jgi:hypothetical protein
LKLNKSKFTTAISLSLLLVPLLVLLPAASASTPSKFLPAGSASTPTPTKGGGAFNATIFTTTTVASFGGYTLYYFTGIDVLTGTETGTTTFTYNLLVYPSGHDVGSGALTCASCTVNGKTGVLNIPLISQGTFGGSGVGQFEATGSGGLAGYRAVGTFQLVTTAWGFEGTYALVYEFA